jgi:hypothetical protein
MQPGVSCLHVGRTHFPVLKPLCAHTSERAGVLVSWLLCFCREDGTPRVGVLRHPSDEVTAEQLERSEVAGATSILQVCAGPLSRAFGCESHADGTLLRCLYDSQRR